MRWMQIADCFVALTIAWPAAAGAENLTSILDSISQRELRQHIETLANDTFEGREAGSRGGYAAAHYLAQHFAKNKLAGAGDRNGYFQLFSGTYRNLLGLLEGSDPTLKEQVVIISAHYDHVGYGNARNSYGPTGFIHNGADDNASGDAALLEAIDALARLEKRPKRSILFAFWDGEEKGLLGSKHWVAHPTIPLNRVVANINVDMIGRLRDDRLVVYGSRSSWGFRRLLSDQNVGGLAIDFDWELKSNSDHYSFYERGMPAMMLHTDLHSDYHRPSDDVEKINFAGMERIVRLLVGAAYALADAPRAAGFRAASHRESPSAKQSLEWPLPALPGRLGLAWDPKDGGPGLLVARVWPGSAAETAGIRQGDRLLELGGRAVEPGEDVRSRVWEAGQDLLLSVKSPDREARKLTVKLPGNPVRVGVSWREDEGEPQSVLLVRVVAGSAADRAGLKVGDRIYAIEGKPFADGADFGRRLATAKGRVPLLMERWGREQTLVLDLHGQAVED